MQLENMTAVNVDELADAENLHREEEAFLQIRSKPRRFGYLAVSILTLSPLLLAAAVSWIGFLWFATNTNQTRHWILVNNWLTRSVTICSLIIRTGGGLLSGVSTAMLAALVLELGGVFPLDVAMISIARAAGSSSMLSPLLLRLCRTIFASTLGAVFLGLGLLLLATSTVIQFSSLLLVSDLQVALVPGFLANSVLPYGFNYSGFYLPPYPRLEMRTAGWYRKPPFYPAFAEYREPPFEQDGVSDTGLTLRAMIPSLSENTRESLQYFSGNTTVLDTRVTCQRPRLEMMNLTISTTDNTFESNNTIVVTGQVWPTIRTPRLVNITTQTFVTNDSAYGLYEFENIGYWFNCSAANNASYDGNDYGFDSGSDLLFVQWRTSLCQLGSQPSFAYAGGLLSEFFEYPRPQSEILGSFSGLKTYGTAYLILNVTSGFTQDWASIPGIFSGLTPSSSAERDEWVDLQFNGGTLSASLCYTAFGSTEEPITIIGNMNRTEPQPGYNYNMSVLTYDEVRKQFGQMPQMSQEERGILALEKKNSWLSDHTQVSQYNYIEMFSDGYGLKLNVDGITPNFTVVLYDWTTSIISTEFIAVPEKAHIHLFQEIVTAGGTIAFALQSILTVLGTMSYYDQILQFDMFGSTEQAFLIPTNVPSIYRGFLILSATLVLYLALVVYITVFFRRLSGFCSLDSEWQAIAHVVTQDTKEILSQASDPAISQKAISKILKDSGNDKVLMRIGELKDTSDLLGTRHRKVGIRNIESFELRSDS
jgi:hypothetical protein